MDYERMVIAKRANEIARTWQGHWHAYPVDTPDPGARLRGVENAPATLQTSRGLARDQ